MPRLFHLKMLGSFKFSSTKPFFSAWQQCCMGELSSISKSVKFNKLSGLKIGQVIYFS